MRTVIYLLTALIFLSCSRKNEGINRPDNAYARGFEIFRHGPVKKLVVYNPWEDARDIRLEYYLVRKDQPVPDSVSGKRIIRTPVEKLICMSTSHIAFLDAIGETDAIEGVSGSYYVSNPYVKQGCDEGRIVDVGYGQNLNYELIIDKNPELVLVYGIGSEVSGFVKKLEDLGISVLIIAEYLEELPLGKTEWIKVIAALFDKEEAADRLFSSVESDYRQLKERVENRTERPTVLVGMPYRDAWWVPGGKSYFANLIGDAGGEYPGKENSSHESYVISFEDAMALSEKSEIWINVGSMNSKKEILEADPRFGKFRVFNHGRIYNNNLRTTPTGGNDFWESGTVYPNRVLSDLIRIFYPELVTEIDFYFYQEIN